MIAVVMGVEDMGQPPAQRLQALDHRLGHGRIDYRDVAGGAVAHQIDVVVLEDGDLLDVDLAHGDRLGWGAADDTRPC